MTMEELIDVAGTAEWRRRKAQEFPSDTRNIQTAELLEKLGPELANLNGSEIHNRLVGILEGVDPFDPFISSEIVSDELRGVGLNWFPETGRDLAAGILAALTRETESAHA